MPLDHYISQVHLKNFYSPKLGNLLYAIRKSDLKSFTPRSEDVCRIEDGSTNSYLTKEREIEDFLKDIEPKYNKSIEKLKSNSPDTECVYTISGFLSYILTCSPAGMRINSNPLKGSVEQTASMLDANNAFPPPPPELGGTMTELIDSGKIKVEIDPKYPQAMGIAEISSYLSIFGNSTWEILHNPIENNPFFTSDFPIVFELSKDPQIFNKIIPLSPELAIRIIPDRNFDSKSIDHSFSNFKYRNRKLKRRDVIILNRQIVRCAEDLVFFRDNHSWIPKFVKKNSRYWIEPQTQKIPSAKGTYMFFSHKIVER